MYWVLQHNIFSEPGFERLEEALQRFGITYSVHKVVPFVGELLPEPEPPPGPVIVMGSYSMALYAQRKGWTPGSFANENHDFQIQVQHWGDAMLNAGARVHPFAEVPKTRELFFIRPVADTKCFAGHVMGWGAYRDWRDRTLALGADNGGTLTGETLVMVSPVKTIYREYRLWVVDSRIVTASLYKEGSRVRYDDRVDEGVLQFCSGFLGFGKWEPARAYCFDVAETEDGYKILEVNNLNAAGFYAADMQKLVMALNSMHFGSVEAARE